MESTISTWYLSRSVFVKPSTRSLLSGMSGAAAGIRGHDAHAGQDALGLGIVQRLGEGDDMRRIQADDAGLERRLVVAAHGKREEQHQQERDGRTKHNGTLEAILAGERERTVGTACYHTSKNVPGNYLLYRRGPEEAPIPNRSGSKSLFMLASLC